MKIFKSRKIALLSVVAMVFTFTLSSAFAISDGNTNDNDIQALNVDNIPKGTLIVDKILEYYSDIPPQVLIEEPDESFEITIINNDTEEKWIKVIEEGSNEFSLAPGNYSLWESNTLGATPIYYKGSSEDGNPEGISFTIENGEDSKIVIRNFFPPQILEADVEIIKTIGRIGGVPHQGVEFTLTPNYDIPLFPVDPTQQLLDFDVILPIVSEVTGTTDVEGKILFENVVAGEYTLSETLPKGFTIQQFDSTIIVESGEDQTIEIVNNMIQNERTSFAYNGSTINGYKMNEMEEGLEGWTINLYKGNSKEPISTTKTDEDGYFEFTELQAGTYVVAEVMQEGWKNLTPIEQEVIIGNDRHEEGIQNFYGDDDLNAAIQNDYLVFTAEGRIGSNGSPQTNELNIHTPPSNIVQEENWVWNNNGVPVDFEVNYYPGDQEVVFTLGNDEFVFYQLPAAYEFSDIMIRTRAVKADSGVMINNLTLDGNPINGSSVALGDQEGIGVLWISGQDLMNSEGFTLRGQTTMYWDPDNAPKNSELAYQIKFGVVPVEEVHVVTFINEEIGDIVPPEGSVDEPKEEELKEEELNEEELMDQDSYNEEIILDEETPLATNELPRTGQRHPRDFYLLGLLISGLGVVVKRSII